MTAPDDPAPESDPSSTAGEDDDDAPPSSGPVSARDAEPGAKRDGDWESDADVPGPPPSGINLRVHGAIIAFLSSTERNEGRDFVVRVVKGELGGDVQPAMLDDIVQAALAEAVECRWPPWLVSNIPAWLKRITRTQIGLYFRKERGRDDDGKKKKNAKNKKPRPEPTARPRDIALHNAEAARLEARGEDDTSGKKVAPAARTAWIADRHSPPTDERARARLIHDWLAARIGDNPAKVQTLALMKQHEVDGFTLPELAAREKTTERALANRFYKLRKELAPQVRLLDDERTRRNALWLILFLGGAALIALVVWLLLSLRPPARPETPVVPPPPKPTASAVAPPPVFNQALPPPPETAPPSLPPGVPPKPPVK
jgi:DNA-directed RNA polymerase specialized sigma24 family protein